MNIPEYHLKIVTETAVPYNETTPVYSPDDLARIMIPRMTGYPVEHFDIVLLNTAHRILGVRNVSIGGLDVSIVEPRAVFQIACLANAASIIAVHNHPSGALAPSTNDIKITKRLTEAGTLMGIPLLDHLIITADGYTSLARQGII